jgi:chromosome partitioning protein
MIISFTNQKGGVGKTTTAVNVAATIATLDKKVLLVDLDPQGNASTGVGFMDRSSLNSSYNVITENMAITDAIYHTEFKNLDLVPSASHLAAAELEIRDFEARERILKGALSVVKDKYDYIFIDCPPALGLLTINALVASDKVIIPCPCEFYALEGIVQLTNTIESIKEYSNPNLDVLGVLVTMYNSRLNISQSIMNDLRNYYGNLLFKTTVVRNVRLAEAPAYGTPILYLDKYSKGAQNYIAVAKEVIERAEHDNY